MTISSRFLSYEIIPEFTSSSLSFSLFLSRVVPDLDPGQYRGFHLHAFLSYLKRSPTPKLGDRRPKVDGNWWLNSTFVAPEMDLNRCPFEKEYFCFDGEKLTLS